jgi:hypothetical protein
VTAVARIIVTWISAEATREVGVRWADGRSISIKGRDATVTSIEDLIREVADDGAAAELYHTDG